MKITNSMKHLKWIYTLLLLTLAACGTNQSEQATESTETEAAENKITINEEQVKQIGLLLGRTEIKIVPDLIRANGMLDVPPQNLVSVTAPLGGIVHETHLLQGTRVKKGEVLVTLKDPTYIQLQQEFLEIESLLKLANLELDRQELLAKENINAQKTLQQARNDQAQAEAKHQGLAAKLRLIGIRPEDLKKTGIQETLSIPSPISGFVTQVRINLGSYVTPQQELFRIVDTEHLHAEIQVFEKDVLKIKVGQLIRLRLVDEQMERLAKVYLIGKEISDERTVRVHGHIAKHQEDLLPGMFFSAIIEAGEGKFTTLPEQAFASFEENDYVFISEGKNAFEMVPVNKGTCANGFCSFTSDRDFSGKEIVFKGTYELLGLLKNTGE